MAPSLGKRCMSFGLRLVSLTNWIPCASGQGWTKDRGTYCAPLLRSSPPCDPSGEANRGANVRQFNVGESVLQ
ncbi:hypothetical protein DER46DRAFT_601426 [Fusarium sp. MPI-SDFR-AT-0072]|nr:hypothetical protein DER46DRAFT_601426 [Fusarium sp. MPI-SDFR-AT-0072]